MIFELFYWPQIQGRGEFVRMLFEDQGADFVDVCRTPDGLERMHKLLHGEGAPLLPFAPPFLRADDLWLSQTAAITSFVGEKLGLAPHYEQDRHIARSIALTIADLVTEVHDTHHPISVEQRYEKQADVAKRRADAFRDYRMPKFLRYLDHRGGDGVLAGSGDITYVDLAAFQAIEGLKYAFPRAFAKLAPELQRLLALHSRISIRPRLAKYLASERRVPFSEDDVFRRYPELDG